MDAMDIMDTNGHVFMDRMDTCSSDVLEPVHSVHDVHENK